MHLIKNHYKRFLFTNLSDPRQRVPLITSFLLVWFETLESFYFFLFFFSQSPYWVQPNEHTFITRTADVFITSFLNQTCMFVGDIFI